MNGIILASMDALDHGCTTDMDVIILASMDALNHGRTRDMDVIILASMDALDHGCTRTMNVIILASMGALDHGCTRDMDAKRQFPFCRASKYCKLQAKEPLPSVLGQHGRSRSWMHYRHGRYYLGQHGCSRLWMHSRHERYYLASMDALNHGCTGDMDTKRQFSCSAAHRNTANYRLKSVFATYIPLRWAQRGVLNRKTAFFFRRGFLRFHTCRRHIQDMKMSKTQILSTLTSCSVTCATGKQLEIWCQGGESATWQ